MAPPITKPARKPGLLFTVCSNTTSFMSLFTASKRKTRLRSASLILLKPALAVTPSSTAGHGAGGRWKGLSHAPPGATEPKEHCGFLQAPAQQPPASGRQQTVPGAKGNPPGRSQPAFTGNAAFPSFLAGRAGLKWRTICIQSGKLWFVIRKLRGAFPQAAPGHVPAGH